MRIKFFKRRPHINREKKRGRPVISFDEKTGRRVKRIALIVGAALFVLLLALLLRPEPMLMSSAEIAAVWERGALRVAILTDVPGMSYDGEGLERDIASALAKRIMEADNAYSTDNLPIEYVEVTEMTVGAKMYDGSVDVALALMPTGANSSYVYSEAYFTDPVELVVKEGGTLSALTKDMLVGVIQSASSDNLYVPSGMTYTRLSSYITSREEEGFSLENNVVKCASYEELFRKLELGEVDCAALTLLMADKHKEEYAFDRTGIVIGKISYSVAAAAQNPALTSVADLVIDDMRDSGELDSLYAKYHLTSYVEPN